MNKANRFSRKPLSILSRMFPLILVLGAVVWLCSTAAAAPSNTPAKPNVIYIMADDLGYGDLGCYGQQRIKTPSIDTMAAQGLRFTDHYAVSTVCAPSRCVLMTGLHTGHCLVRNNREVRPMGQMPLETGTVTVARLALFNLKTDLGETKNIAGNHPDWAARLQNIMAAAHVDSPHFN